jgi:hypothetical protein
VLWACKPNGVIGRDTFLAAHWDGLAAADFFTVEVLTLRGLVRYAVLFVMKLKTRTRRSPGSPVNQTRPG